MLSGSFLNISSRVVKGAWIEWPLLLPLNPFFLKSRVCLIRSLMSNNSSLLELPTDIDRCLRVSAFLISLIAGSTDWTGDPGRDVRGVRLSLTCMN